jgi:hypothetical protein
MNAADKSEKTEEQLWKIYLFLSREMLNALSLRDMALFLEFMRQRGNLQPMIAARQDRSFSNSEEGRSLIRNVKNYNQEIIAKLRTKQNLMVKKQQVSLAYDIFSTGKGEKFSCKL